MIIWESSLYNIDTSSDSGKSSELHSFSPCILNELCCFTDIISKSFGSKVEVVLVNNSFDGLGGKNLLIIAKGPKNVSIETNGY